uniref:Uncharacterized protein n=1 Tax=Glossina austeni TaxID=7395 RepID=A0A1A9VAD0_GLOAU
MPQDSTQTCPMQELQGQPAVDVANLSQPYKPPQNERWIKDESLSHAKVKGKKPSIVLGVFLAYYGAGISHKKTLRNQAPFDMVPLNTVMEYTLFKAGHDSPISFTFVTQQKPEYYTRNDHRTIICDITVDRDYDSNLSGGLFFYIDLLVLICNTLKLNQKLRAINSSLYQTNLVIAYMSIPTNM